MESTGRQKNKTAWYTMKSVEKKLKRIMALDWETKDIELKKLAKELGCSLQSSHTSKGYLLEEEMIRRIREAARSIRESRLWWIAIISAVASVLSALAAWSAVFW